jgi:hypothetical protein
MTVTPAKKPAVEKGQTSWRAKTKRDRRVERVTAVLSRAEKSGLLKDKNGRIAARISAELIKQAKARTGLVSDTELLEFALANIAIEDDFVETFRALGGTVDLDIKLGY